jgi:hypothetical protein
MFKGKGLMKIDVKNENVPHFCFTCGSLGHAAQNCDDVGADTQGINYGEELRSFPPKRAREITIRPVAPRDLSEEEETSDSGSAQQTDLLLALAVDRFYARKFGMKAGSGADKRAVLKVSKSRAVKKQKTPNKSCMQGVLQVDG